MPAACSAPAAPSSAPPPRTDRHGQARTGTAAADTAAGDGGDVIVVNDGWLIASSQGDNAYALYRLRDGRPDGRFRIVPGRVGGTEETDGIAAAAGSFGPGLRGGLLVVQDGVNDPAAQNFKLVSWDAVRRAVRGRP